MAVENRRGPSGPPPPAHSLAVLEPQEAPIARTAESKAMALERMVSMGDLAELSPAERVNHYLGLCESLGLNPYSRPFDWIYFKGGKDEPDKLVLYPNASCTAQLRRQHHLRIEITRREIVGELFVCEATAHAPGGRTDTATKYVPITWADGNRFKGQNLANAMMKAETGAKRRVTLSMIGLATPPDADEALSWRSVHVEATGHVLENPTPEQKALAADPVMARTIGAPTYESVGAASGSPLAGMADQRPRPDELERPVQPSGPRPTFKPSEDDIRRWLGAWFGIVDETPWDSKEARARRVMSWTAAAGWPDAKQTDSLRTMFARCTESEVRDFLAETRAMVDAWKEGQAAEVAGEPELGSDVGLTPESAAEEVVKQEGSRSYGELFPDDEAPAGPPRMTPEGHVGFVLTGAPNAPRADGSDSSTSNEGEEEEISLPDEIDLRDGLTKPQIVEQYTKWSAVLARMEPSYRPKYAADELDGVPYRELLPAVEALIPHVKAVHAKHVEQAGD